jgi:polyphosphate kinase 2 (PPK2 family)
MALDFSDYERGEGFDGDYDEALAALQTRLAHIQFRHIIHGQRTVVVVEGWDAAGKGGAIRRMVAEWDPRYFQVYPIGAPTREELERHFLWRFWQKLPGAREIAIFDRSWYGRVLVERVEGFCSEADWRRGYDQINEFEAQQIESGTHLVKLFFHVTQAQQDRRLRDRIDHPLKRWKITVEDFRNRAKRADYLAAISDMVAETDTRWAPWRIIDGNNKKAARIAAMSHVADVLDEKLPKGGLALDPELARMAGEAFGYSPAGDGAAAAGAGAEPDSAAE